MSVDRSFRPFGALACAVVSCAGLLFSTAPVGAVGTKIPFDFEPESTMPGPVGSTACSVGETRAGGVLYLGVYSVGDVHFVLVDPATCSACPNGTIQLNGVKFRGVSNAGDCSVTLELSVVGAAGGANGCFLPDTTRILCPPISHKIIATAPSPIPTYVLPLAGGCCIQGKAFVRVRVTENQCPYYDPLDPTSGQWPAIGAVLTCIPCRSYWLWNENNTLYDGCDPFYAANDAILVDADCCSVVPTTPQSWGRMKTLYR